MINKIYGMVQEGLIIDDIIEYSILGDILRILDIEYEEFIKFYNKIHDIDN